MLTLAIAALVLWIVILILPWKPWLVREKWDPRNQSEEARLDDVTVLIPARNEEKVISRTVKAILNQGEGIKVRVIDDQSTDTTRTRLREFGNNIIILHGKELPPGWSGKLWALEQGRELISTPLVLLVDADILLAPGVVQGLKRMLLNRQKDMISLLASPSLESNWEKMLMPAFVYYFKLLYPFSLANSRNRLVAAAAGGCILLKKEALDEIGGFQQIRGTLIDDCGLAREIKKAGYQTWLGLTRSIISIRPYQGLSGIWNMVARTAYTQLNHSFLLLIICTVIMVLAYFVPVITLWYSQQAALLGAITLLIMHITYLPVLNYYRQSWLWAPAMPLIAAMFLGMTWTSAWRYWRGERMRWRGRKLQAIPTATSHDIRL